VAGRQGSDGGLPLPATGEAGRFAEMGKHLTITVRQAERFTAAGLDREASVPGAGTVSRGSLSGVLARDRVPDEPEFRAVRTLLSASLLRRGEPDGVPGHED
jgi:hypothetical protein